MGSVEETQTQQPSWHVKAQNVGDPAASSQYGDVATSSIPPDTLLEGEHAPATDNPSGAKPGSQGLSTLPAFPIPLEMSFQSNDMRSFESGDTSSELFTLPPRPIPDVNGSGAQAQADDRAAGGQATSEASVPAATGALDHQGSSVVQQHGAHDQSTADPTPGQIGDPNGIVGAAGGEAGHGLQSEPTGLNKSSATPPPAASPAPSLRAPFVPSPPSNLAPLRRFPSDADQLASDPPLGHEGDEEAPQIQSPPDSDPQEIGAVTPKRAVRASTHKTPAKSLLFTPEKAPSRPITSHDPSPLKNTRSVTSSRPFTKPPTFGRDFKRTISAPTTTEQDSFGEDPKLPPRRRVERYLTTSPKGWVPPAHDGQEDEGEVTDQESVKESATVSQSLQLDDIMRDRGARIDGSSPPSPLMRISEVDERTSPPRGLDPTQLNTSPPVQSSVGPPTSSPTRQRIRLSSPEFAATHLNTSPPERKIAVQGSFSDHGHDDIPRSSSLQGRIGADQSPTKNDDDSESDNPLFTDTGHPAQSPSPYERPRFQNMPSSTASSNRLHDDSQLLGDRSEKDFGTDEPSQAEIDMAATQAIRQSQATASAPSSPNAGLHITVAAVAVAAAPSKPIEPASATSSSGGRLTIPQNRLLTRRKQQSEASLPHRNLGIVPPTTRALSSGSRTPKEVPIPIPRTAGYEPTQVSQSLQPPLPFTAPTPAVHPPTSVPSAPRTAPLPRVSGLEPTQVSQPHMPAMANDALPQGTSGDVSGSSVPVNANQDQDPPASDHESRLAVLDLEISQPPPTNEVSPGVIVTSVPSLAVASQRQEPPHRSSSMIQPGSLPSPVANQLDVGANEPQQSTNRTFPPTPPPRPVPTKKYGTPKKGKRMSMPSKKVREARELQDDVDMLSDISSGTTISRDPDDETFRPVKKKHKRGSMGKGKGKDTKAERAGLDQESGSDEDEDEDLDTVDDGDRNHVVRRGGPKKAVIRAGNSTSRKRRAASRSRSKDARQQGESDGGSSGTTPDDHEDDTYQPFRSKSMKGLAGRVMPSRVAGRSTRASSASTERRPRKRSKLKPSKGDRTSDDVGGAKVGFSELDTRNASPAPSVRSDGSRKLQVMGYWKGSKQYFVGVVQGPLNGRFHVRFADGLEAELTIDQMRLFDIRPGDEVRSNERGASKKNLKVVEAYDGDVKGVKVHSDPTETAYIPLKYVCVPATIVNRDWNDRLVEPGHLGLANSAELVRNGNKSSTGLAGKIFLITINEVDRDGSIRKPLEASIVAQGGKIAEDWTELFEASDDGFWSKLSTKDTPFLLVHGPEGAKPKILAALAAGIPCLSAEFIAHHAQRAVDWRAYLVSPGRSAIHGQFTSQMIDPNWGEQSWSPMTARNPRQFLAGKKILFAIAQRSDSQRLVPLLRKLVPFCLHALGAVSVEQVNHASASKDLKQYDYVIVEDRVGNLKIPASWEQSGNVCNFIWLKQCIISGGLLPPALLKESR